MRTRRSPRNQEILWRALGAPPQAKHDATTVESLERQLAACMNARTRRMIERELVKARMRESRRHEEKP